MQDLQEITHEVHYENYRSEKMAAGGTARKIKLVVHREMYKVYVWKILILVLHNAIEQRSHHALKLND